MHYRFSIDDNILFFKDISENNYSSIFENPYLSFFKKMHDRYGTRFQFNIYNETDGFELSQMSDRYKKEWNQNSDWLHLSFHARADSPPDPYLNSTYDRAYSDCINIHNQIIRFAGNASLDYYTTVHYCQASDEAIHGFKDAGIKGLVGLYDNKLSCYGRSFDDFIEPYVYDTENSIYLFSNDLILNLCDKESIIPLLESKKHKKFLEIMIHEQYYYESYPCYQPDFCDKVETAISYLTKEGRKSVFLSELI